MLTLTPEIDPEITSHQICDTREVKLTKYSKYGISYALDTELAQNEVNRPLGRDMTSRTRSCLMNQKSQTLEILREPYKS